MVEAEEMHFKLGSGGSSFPGVEKVKCSRVYHLNLVLKLKSRNLPDSQQDARDANKTMQIERVRLVVNQTGILRLEPLGRVLSPQHNLNLKASS